MSVPQEDLSYIEKQFSGQGSVIWRAVCIKNNRVIERNNFGPRRRGRGLVGVTDVGVVTHCVCF